MAIIFQDYFESYPLGPGVPTGFTLAGGSQSNIVNSPPLVGIEGSKAWQLIGFAQRFFTPNDFMTQFIALWAFPNQQNADIIVFGNGDPTGATVSRDLFRMQEEPDSTMSFFAGDGFFLGNTGSAGFSFTPFTWYTLQLNITFSKVTIVGVDVLRVDFELTFQGLTLGQSPGGVTLTGGHTMPSIPLAALYTGAAEANNMQYQGSGMLIDSLTLEDQVPLNTYPIPGSPVARVYQGTQEVMELPNDGENRVIQGVIELQELPDTSLCRVIQGVIELMVTGGPRGRGWFPEYRRPRTFISNQ